MCHKTDGHRVDMIDWQADFIEMAEVVKASRTFASFRAWGPRGCTRSKNLEGVDACKLLWSILLAL